jgi:hemoglobin
MTLTEDDLRRLVETFYGRVRQDPELGPVFARAIPDDAWPEHLAIIQSFWSAVMLKTGRYKRDPFSVHRRIEGISPALFTRWLALFEATCRELFEPEVATALQEKATMIARSLQAGLFFQPAAVLKPPPAPQAAGQRR